MRVFNVPIPLAGMLVGACSQPRELGSLAVPLVLASCMGCAATQCFNDYEDREVDALNASFRPIPAGELRAGEVLVAGYGLTLLWAGLSLCFDWRAALLVFAVFALTRWYSRAKRVTLVHHLLLPAALGLMPVYGALMAGGSVPPLAVYAGLSIFLIDVNMNIVGAFKDLWDGSAHERVLPVVWGARPAVAVALVAAVVGIGVQLLALARELCGPEPLVPLALGLLLTLHSRLRLLRTPTAVEGYAALKSGRLTECLTFPALLAGLLPLRSALFAIAALTFFALVSQALIPEAELPDGAARELS